MTPADVWIMNHGEYCHSDLILPRKEVETHSPDCPELPVPCSFADAGSGCNQLVKNKDLAAHIQASIIKHLSLISAQNII